MLRSLKDSETTPDSIAENLLSFLERLKTMPTDSAELNAFWISELGVKPPKASRDTKQQGDVLDEPVPVDDDDWRTFFDDGHTSKSTTTKSGQARVHTLSTHQSLHSLASHRAQFSSCWMTLLPHIASSSSLAARALAVLHRGVMPHMDKPVRLMDWVGGCVDFGSCSFPCFLSNEYSTGYRWLNWPPGAQCFVYAYQGLQPVSFLLNAACHSIHLMLYHISDYPDFYTRLYAFLTRDVMHLKYRARFFRLTDIFLSST